MLRIDNSYNVASKGYVHESVYKHLEDGLADKVTELRRKNYSFENIPKYQLDEILQEKIGITKNMDKIEKAMSTLFHSDTFLYLTPKHNGKGEMQISIGNENLPDTYLPLVKKTSYWYPSSFLTSENALNSVAQHIESSDVVKSTESELFEAWLKDSVKPFVTNDLGDKFYRFILKNKAKSILKRLNIKDIDVDAIIQKMIERYERNQENRQAEKNFINNLKF